MSKISDALDKDEGSVEERSGHLTKRSPAINFGKKFKKLPKLIPKFSAASLIFSKFTKSFLKPAGLLVKPGVLKGPKKTFPPAFAGTLGVGTLKVGTLGGPPALAVGTIGAGTLGAGTLGAGTLAAGRRFNRKNVGLSIGLKNGMRFHF